MQLYLMVMCMYICNMDAVYIIPDMLVGGLPETPAIVHTYVGTSNLERQKVQLNSYTFSFLRAGTKRVVHGADVCSIDASAFVLMRAGNCLMTEHLTDEAGYESVLLFFTADLLGQILDRHPELRAAPDAMHINSVVAFNYDHYIQAFVNSLEHIKDTPKLLELKVEEILLYLHQKDASAVTGMLAAAITLSDDELYFKQVVVANAHLSVDDLCFMTHKSRSTFQRVFQRIFGMPPGKWLLEKRMEHAAYLLKHKHLRPTDVYTEVGFENLSAFSAAFKQHYGVTPMHYRQQ